MKFRYRRYYLYYLGRAAASIIYFMPLGVALFLARAIGTAAYHCLPAYRRVALENLQEAFSGEKSGSEMRSIARGVFRNLAMVAVEMVRFPRIDRSNIDDYVRTENLEAVDASFRAGRGTIVLTAHFGNWELVAMTLRVKGYPGVAIGRKIYFHKYDEYLNRLRKVHDVNVIDRESSPRSFLRILRDNKIVGILADQDVDSVDGVFVDFFGRPAHTPVGPVVLAKASGATIVPIFAVREGLHHRFVVEDPIELVDTGDKERDVVTNTQAWSRVLESFIRRYPDHWVWIHRRWKTAPASDADGRTGKRHE
jgi:KDO2-lipid IV(A) lauroyltransferase